MDCVVYGAASSYTGDVVEILGRLSWQICGLIDNLGEAPRTRGTAPVVGLEDIPDDWFDYAVVIPVATPGHRLAAEEQSRAMGFTRFPVVVDPTSVVARSAALSGGCVVNAGVVIAAGAELHGFASVNRSASIGHDATLESYTFIGPGATLCGDVRVGRGTFIGAGAVIMPGVTIGANSVVGAGAVATQAVPAGTVVVGNPARVVSRPGTGYRGFNV